MNKFFICILSICLCASAYGQGNNVGIGTPIPDPSAVLDLTATTQGFLPPRTHIGLIAAPVVGLIVFDLDSNCLIMYNTAGWKNLCSPATSWLIDGNSNTTSAVNFLGTTNNQDLVIKTNSSEVMRATTGGQIGIQTPAPDPTSILDITSTTQGVLFPSLTTVQRDAIATPAVGLTIYNNTLNVHQFWNGTCWVNVGQTVCSFTYATNYITPAHNSDCLLVSNFSSVSDTINVALVAGTASPVILTALGVPAGVVVNFSKNYILPTSTGIQSVISLTALPSAPPGVDTITVLAQSGSTVQTLTYYLTVFGFGLTINPASATVNAGTLTHGGQISQATVSIGNASACASTGGIAILTYSINPTAPGILVNFGTTAMPIPGSTTMTLNSACPGVGTYQITVNAQIGVTSSQATYLLTIVPASPIHVSVSQANLNLATLLGNICAGLDTIYIDPGVVINSADPSLPAITTGSLSTGSFVLINNGSIIGAGGNGGADTGTVSGSSCPGGNGGPGGDAIDIVSSVSFNIINNGTIASGGGGGGCGAAVPGASAGVVCGFTLGNTFPGAGGGGGAGSAPGLGGVNSCMASPAAQPGTATTGGAGGTSSSGNGCGVSCNLFGLSVNISSGNGGMGGALGQAGSNGGNFSVPGGISLGTTCPTGPGGPAGYAIYSGSTGAGCGCWGVTGNSPIGPTH